MRILLTGATGFVGRHVLHALVDCGHSVRALMRRGGAPEGFEGSAVTLARGDINGPLQAHMESVDGVVHLVGIIQEDPRRGITFDALHTRATRHVVAEARAAGISRMVYVSANGASEHGATAYQRTKWLAEQAVATGGFDQLCVLRPGLIFGDPGREREEFCTRLAADMILPLPMLPIFGDGRYPMQPIHVNEVAQAAVQALTLPAAHGKVICAVGRKRLSYVAVVDLLTEALGLAPKRKIHVPIGLVRRGVKMVRGLAPITPDQLTMLVAGNIADETVFYEIFDVDERPFTAENLAYLRARA